MKLKEIILLLFLLLIVYSTRAQTTLEVVTKTMEKTVSYSSDGNIFITGENATIRIGQWDRQEVKVKIKLITKHRVKNIAISELNNIKYLMEKSGKNVYLRNYFLAGDEPSTGCIMKVEYELTVPAKSNFSIKNNLGNIAIENTEGKLNVEAKFGNIVLSNTKGNITIDITMGDIQASDVSGVATIKANHSNIEMKNLAGKYNFKLTNSDLLFQPIKKIELLDVEAKNGDVTYIYNNVEEYNYNFSTLYGEIKVPDIFKNKIHSEKNKFLFENKNSKNNNSIVNIKSEFGNIILTK